MKQVISIGSSANDGTGDPIRTAFQKSAANFSELYGQIVNAGTTYGAVADGATSINGIVSQAIADSVKVLIFDQGVSFYNVTATISLPSGFSLVAGRGRPQFKITSASVSRAFSMAGVTDAHIVGIALDGNKSVVPSDVSIVINNGSSQCSIEDCLFTNLAGYSVGGVAISGGATRNVVRNCQFDNSAGTNISIIGAHENIIDGNQMRNSGGWGVGVQSGSLRNSILNNQSIMSGLEAIAVQSDCWYTRVIGNHCELAGDNGISISARSCAVEGNICLTNQYAGIGVWGSNNIISGNICKNNNQSATSVFGGIYLDAMYGGTGSFNIVSHNVLEDDQSSPTQRYGVRIKGNDYTAWAQGQVISDLTNNSQLYHYSGLNIYKAQNAGTTGATPPTHTSGTVSDGGVNWTYLGSFTTAAGALWNLVSGNIVNRFSIAAYFDADSWQRNTLYTDAATSLTITADGSVRAKPN